jgi:hypothetical protein
MQSRWNCPTNGPTKWSERDWERAWESAVRRINGMPPELVSCTQIHESLMTMDEGFIHGDSKTFEDGLIVLLDRCAELINRGDYPQWW